MDWWIDGFWWCFLELHGFFGISNGATWGSKFHPDDPYEDCEASILSTRVVKSRGFYGHISKNKGWGCRGGFEACQKCAKQQTGGNSRGGKRLGQPKSGSTKIENPAVASAKQGSNLPRRIWSQETKGLKVSRMQVGSALKVAPAATPVLAVGGYRRSKTLPPWRTSPKYSQITTNFYTYPCFGWVHAQVNGNRLVGRYWPIVIHENSSCELVCREGWWQTN